MTAEVTTDKKPTQSEQAEKAAEAVRAQGDLWHTGRGQSREAWLSFDVDEHREHWPVMSRTVELLIRATALEQLGISLSVGAVHEAQRRVETWGIVKGPHFDVFLRVAEVDGAIWIDLHDDDWRAIRVTKEGWIVVDEPPVHFRHVDGMEPLPIPMHGGSVGDLRRFLNLASDDDWIMLASYIVAALRPTGPFPILELAGVKGSSKSTTSRVIGKLVDPSDLALLKEPKQWDGLRDLMLEVRERRLICFDNLSRLDRNFSDYLCGLSTGIGMSTRKLRTDYERIRIKASLPVIINGIAALAERGDLIDRTILIALPFIEYSDRVAERAFWADFEKERPLILGTLLDAVSGALRRLPDVHVEHLPRMADFAEWSVAAAPDLGWTGAEFLSAYEHNRLAATMVAMESSAIANALIDMCPWQGTPTELLAELGRRCDVDRADYPANTRALAHEVDRLRGLLFTVDVEVTRHHGHGPRSYTIRRPGVGGPTAKQASQASQASREEAA
jgi:hypothetical protein